MILDNADNADTVLPSTNPKVSSAVIQKPLNNLLKALDSKRLLMVTTRNRHAGEVLINEELCIEVPPFSLQEAESLLQSKAQQALDRSEPSAPGRLLYILARIPLAITQASAFINRNRMTVQSYLAALEEDKQNLADYLSHEFQDHRRERGFNSVFQTWKLSFDQILEQEPQTAKLLSLMAMLDPQQIPEELLRQPTERDVDFRTAIGTLHGFALITQEVGGEIYAIHPLVQASVHYWLEQRSEKAHYDGQALQVLAEKFPNGDHEHKKTCESMYAHAQAVLCYEPRLENDLRHCAALLYNVGRFDWRQGRYASAYEAVSKAYNINRKRSGEVATSTLDSLSLLALVLRYQGNYEVAEEMQRQALKGFEKVLGVEHPDILTSVSNLASVLQDQGKYEVAENMHRQALKGCEKVLGVDHPSTLNSVYCLAYLFHIKKQFSDASDLYLRAKAGFLKTLGPLHPNTQSCSRHYEFMIKERDGEGREV